MLVVDDFNRIVEIVDNPIRFGFMYATTAFHVEEGQERFAIDFDPESGSWCLVSLKRYPVLGTFWPGLVTLSRERCSIDS